MKTPKIKISIGILAILALFVSFNIIKAEQKSVEGLSPASATSSIGTKIKKNFRHFKSVKNQNANIRNKNLEDKIQKTVDTRDPVTIIKDTLSQAVVILDKTYDKVENKTKIIESNGDDVSELKVLLLTAKQSLDKFKNDFETEKDTFGMSSSTANVLISKADMKKSFELLNTDAKDTKEKILNINKKLGDKIKQI
ncbi:MAG: hypothetical protein WCP15_01215 [bacterium]